MSGAGNRRAARTRDRLRQALLDACEERVLAEVSVAEVVRRAGVNRSAFYLHYNDIPAFAVDTCAEVVRTAVEALHAWRGISDPVHPPAALTELFADVPERAALYRTLLRPGEVARWVSCSIGSCVSAAAASGPWWACPPRIS
jgi:AcrR family transcriptional regulator